MEILLHPLSDRETPASTQADAGDNLSDSGWKSLSMRQRMQECPYQTADAGDSLSDSGWRKLYQTAGAGDTLSDSGCRYLSNRKCRSLSIRQRMQETLYQTGDAGVCLIERLLHPLSDRDTPASAVL